MNAIRRKIFSPCFDEEEFDYYLSRVWQISVMMDNIFDQVNISPFTQKIDEDCIELIEVYRSASLFSFVCHYFVGISMK
jgi:hypothetical protein